MAWSTPGRKPTKPRVAFEIPRVGDVTVGNQQAGFVDDERGAGVEDLHQRPFAAGGHGAPAVR